jgi:tetratricopeptide (TPR) repeat protein
MHKLLVGLGLAGTLCIAVTAQKIEKPTLKPKPCTDAQEQTVREGVSLHDAKQFAAAVEKYQQVIAENPDCTLVQYELSMTYYAMGEKTKAMETAYRGSKYQSEELALFYLTMANVIDDVGKPDEAVRIYRDAIKMLDGNKEMREQLSSIYYNLGVTLTKQKKYDEARAELKRAVEHNFAYPSPHYLLSLVYSESNYKVPAFLAAARFLSVELSGQRSQNASRIIRSTLRPAPKDEKTGNIKIFVDLNAPKDEGDFGMFELFLGTLTINKNEANDKRSDEQRFVDAVGTLIALVAENKGLKSTFVGKNYVPYLAEMKKLGYVEVLAYVVLLHSGNESALPWLNANEAKVRAFIVWSTGYRLPI